MSPRTRGRDWLIYLTLVALTIGVFSRVRHSDFVDYDDLDYVVDNVHVTTGFTPENVAWAFSHAYEHTGGPLTWLSYMADASPGLDAGRFHLTNLVLHLVSVCLLFAALANLTGARGPSAFVAALFAIHPLHVESVAWIAERKDVLSGLFFNLALRLYSTYVHRGGRWWYGAVLLAFSGGLMSKPIVITLPVLLLLLDYWPLRRFDRRAVLEKVPLLVMAGVVAALMCWRNRIWARCHPSGRFLFLCALKSPWAPTVGTP